MRLPAKLVPTFDARFKIPSCESSPQQGSPEVLQVGLEALRRRVEVRRARAVAAHCAPDCRRKADRASAALGAHGEECEREWPTGTPFHDAPEEGVDALGLASIHRAAGGFRPGLTRMTS